MESGDPTSSRKAKRNVPPVPLKTYRWEDLRREKRRGKYPWTHLYKNPYIEDLAMEEESEFKKPVEKKKKIVKKVVKKVKKKEAPKEPDVSTEAEMPKEDDTSIEILSKEDLTERKDTSKDETHKPKEEDDTSTEPYKSESENPEVSESPVPRIELVETPENASKASEEDASQKMEVEELSIEDKVTEYLKEELPKDSITIIDESRRLSKERETDEGKEIETISGSNEKITITSQTEDESEPMDIDIKEVEITSIESSQISEDVTKDNKEESEDTYEENNVEQYLDTDDMSKLSTANVSVNEEFVSSAAVSEKETEAGTSKVLLGEGLDKKRKHSSASEITKSTLSLFQKMKNAKFKPPTFKIPKFKKLIFKKAKTERKNSKTLTPEETTVIKQKATLPPQTKQGSPVYIHIPLHPTPEQLEEEKRQVEERYAKEVAAKVPNKASSPVVKRGEKSPKNGVKTKKFVDIKSVTSRWKDKKSPPLKKKETKPQNSKKGSPKTEKLPGIAAVQASKPKKPNSPVYIYIPLKPTDDEWKEEPKDANSENNEEQHYETEINGTEHSKVSYIPKLKETDIDFTDKTSDNADDLNETVISSDETPDTPLTIKIYKETVLDSEFFGIVHLETPIDYTEDDPRINMSMNSRETDIDFVYENTEASQPIIPTEQLEDDPSVSMPMESVETTTELTETSEPSETKDHDVVPLQPRTPKETPIDYTEDDPRVLNPAKAKETAIDFPHEDVKTTEQTTPMETPIDYTEDDPRVLNPPKAKETDIDFTDETIVPEEINKTEEILNESAETIKTDIDFTDDKPSEPETQEVLKVQLPSQVVHKKVTIEEKPKPANVTIVKEVNKEKVTKTTDKKEPNKKVEKFKETTAKLGEDIKHLASKFKADASKAKKISPFKKKQPKKTSPVLTKAMTSAEKRSSLKKQDSPKYVFIPLKGPINDKEKTNEKLEDSDPEMPALENEERIEVTETKDKTNEISEAEKMEVDAIEDINQVESENKEEIVNDIKENIELIFNETKEKIESDITEDVDKIEFESTDKPVADNKEVVIEEKTQIKEETPKAELPKTETVTEKTGTKPKTNKTLIEKGKDTTLQLSKDFKKFTAKLKEIKRSTKMPTKKIGKPGSKKISPKIVKKSSPTEHKKSPPQAHKKRGDSPVEYIHIPLTGPLPPELAEREILGTEETNEPTEMAPVTNISERSEQQTSSPKEEAAPATKPEVEVDTSKFVLFKDKPQTPKKELPKITPIKRTKVKTKTEKSASSSPFDSLKKTKDFSKKTFLKMKEAVTPKEKTIVKKIEITTVTKKSPTAIKKEEPDYIIIPPKQTQEEPKVEEAPKEDIPPEVAVEEKASITNVSQITTEDISIKDQNEASQEIDPVVSSEDPNLSIDDIIDDTSFDVSEIKEESQLEDIKSEVSIPQTAVEEHRLSKEDEEDGLKMTQNKDITKPEETIKSSLKAEDSPKMNKKVSFKDKSASEEENTVKEVKKEDTKDDRGYEIIEVKDSKPVFPTDKKAILETAQSMSVDEEKSYLDKKLIKNTSLDEDYNKWSKSIDHEYEPINPPAQSAKEVNSSVHAADKGSAAHTAAPPDIQAENRLLRIPLDTELVIQGEDDAALSQDESLSIQDRRSGRYLSTPDTCSRTEDINTSQIDSSALEHLPLKKGNRKQAMEQTEQPQTSNLQSSFRNHADKLKTKFKNMKKPSLTIQYRPKFEAPKFQRPKFQKPKFERPKFKTPSFKTPKFETPKFTMPKMPERPKINFPSFSLPRTGKRSTEDRHFSTTESTIDSKKNIFDFRTYPRLFDKTKKKKEAEVIAVATTSEETPVSQQFETAPQKTQRKKGPVGARWVHRFSDIKYADEDVRKSGQFGSEEDDMRNRSDSLERRMEEDLRYKEALDADEDMKNYEKENQEIHNTVTLPARWSHGSFHQYKEQQQQQQNGDEEDIPQLPVNGQSNGEFDSQQNFSEKSSVGSSGSRRRQGVLEEIDSDQFFLRQKGISQDNIQVGMYLSSEIRDAFKQPINTLEQMENVPPGYGNREYDLDASDLSLSKPRRPKRKHLKKTKKIKKTPHASKDDVSRDQDSINTEPEEYPRNYKTFPPSRPRRAKKTKIGSEEQKEANLAKSEDMLDEIDLNEEEPQKDGQNGLRYNEQALMYENEVMKDIEQPEIIIQSDQKETTIAHFGVDQADIDKYLEETGLKDVPKPPKRRHRSLRSLTMSEHDSIMGEFNKDRYIDDMLDQEIKVYRTEHEYLSPSLDEPPVPPKRRSRSRSQTASVCDDDRTSKGADSIVSECHEPPCIEDSQEAIPGYATINKSAKRPSIPKRRRSTKSNRSNRSSRSNRSNRSEPKFFTVPRSLNDSPAPVRPIRNYSTLGPSRPPRKKLPQHPIEEKENIEVDITEYIEIDDDDHTKDLQSGEIISKMKGRPLPAPPRPPRKHRESSREPLQDITHEDNIEWDGEKEPAETFPASEKEAVVEIEVSTQTDPLPDDFTCEEMVEEPTDRIVAPTRRRRSRQESMSKKERPQSPLQRSVSPNAMIIERRVETPTQFEDETVTHASILVKPVAEYPPDSYVNQRFAADIPSILQEPITHQEIPRTYIHEELPPPQESYTEESIQKSELPPYEEDFVPRLDDVCDSCEQIDDICPPESSEVPEIPEKPARSKLQALLDTEILSEPEPQEEICETPQKPQRTKVQAASPLTSEPPRSEVQPQVIERIIERQVPYCVTAGPDTEVEVLKAQKLQVVDLDVERLNVSELQAHKITVSEIDGVTIQISELTSKTGSITVNGLEIPSGLIQEILDRLQPLTQSAPPLVREQVSTQTDELKKSEEETQTSRSSSKEPIAVKEMDEPLEEISKKQMETSEAVASLIPEVIEQPLVQVESATPIEPEVSEVPTTSETSEQAESSQQTSEIKTDVSERDASATIEKDKQEEVAPIQHPGENA